MLIRIIILALFTYHTAYAQHFTISGYIKERSSKESVPGATIVVNDSQIGTVSNEYGFYSISTRLAPPFRIRYASMGYSPQEIEISQAINATINVDLDPVSFQLEGLVFKEKSLQSPGSFHIPLDRITNGPAFLGEKDIIKTLHHIPGVKMGMEGFASFYVRGGGMDQNLILLDDAPVYNANHVFGLFSAFNVDAIKNVTFWKDFIPARYGGRLSSVLSMQMREGNKEKMKTEGGIGLTSSRILIEGPLKKGKGSFLLAARRSYIDLLMKPFEPENLKQGFSFYDINAKGNWVFNPKNSLYLSLFYSKDNLSEDEYVQRISSNRDISRKMNWSNKTSSLRWNHQFNAKLFSNTTFYYSQYRYGISEENKYLNDNTLTHSDISYKSQLKDYSFKTDLDFYLSDRHTLTAGSQFTIHQFEPRYFSHQDKVSHNSNITDEHYINQELSLYMDDKFRLNDHLSANVGLRISGLFTDSKTYIFPEPRVSVHYQWPEIGLVRLAYTRTNQFLHLLSNTGLGLSTDLYIPVTGEVIPPQADQISIGISKDFAEKEFSVTVESYRKWMRNIVTYKEGASFISFSDGPKDIPWQNNITFGNGLSYGTEVLVRKDVGQLTGWVGYTLSWTTNQFEEINNGKPFFSNSDRRHDVNITASYQLTEKLLLGMNWKYASGNYLTIPTAFSFGIKGNIGNLVSDPLNINTLDYFGSKNSYKAEDYHRLDLSLQLKNKKRRKWESYWEFSLYNAYWRKNPTYYYIQYRTNTLLEEQPQLKKKSLFPVIPGVSYNFKF